MQDIIEKNLIVNMENFKIYRDDNDAYKVFHNGEPMSLSGCTGIELVMNVMELPKLTFHFHAENRLVK